MYQFGLHLNLEFKDFSKMMDFPYKQNDKGKQLSDSIKWMQLHTNM